MKQKRKLFIRNWWTFILLLLGINISSCKKENIKSNINESQQLNKIKLPLIKNPYSLRNIEKATLKVNAKLYSNSSAKIIGKDLPQYVYFKFNPNELNTEEFKSLENDSTVRLLDFPFGNAALYNEDFALDEKKKEQLTDGNIYGVTNIENKNLLDLIKLDARLKTEFIDTLALIPEEDTALQYQAFLEAGGTEEQVARLRLCLLKRPTGYVRYWDDEYGRVEPVRNMQVWGLVFGIPIHTYTDDNGYYRLPYRFNVGTIMGTHAKNSRVNIKPFNTMGGFFQATAQLIVNFVVGSVHVKGWVSSCSMRNDVNFYFNEHKQNKYWSQLLNAYYFHDRFTDDDGINNAPQNMVCYAHWADEKDFGSASTPMLYHLTGGQLTDDFINYIFGNQVTGRLLELIHGLLPDMTFKVCGGTQPDYYNARLAQTAFHELGHASMYRQVGAGWHWALDWAELWHHCDGVNSNNPYCDPNYSGSNHVSLAESWAEFLGTNYAIRLYGDSSRKIATSFFELDPFNNIIVYNFNKTLIEKERWFFGGKWIPYGIFNDLMDEKNSDESWDLVEGATIKQMYDAFNPNIASICEYQNNFLQNNPIFNQQNVKDIFINHACNCK